MEYLTELSWKIYPSIAMMAVGLATLFKGASTARRGLGSPMSDPTRMARFVIGFRIAVIGVTMAGLGAAWNWNLLWLFVLSLVFGGEELLESTIHLSILRRSPSYPPVVVG
jgi:type IV secretory pathway VirB2 component (pilin)